MEIPTGESSAGQEHPQSRDFFWLTKWLFLSHSFLCYGCNSTLRQLKAWHRHLIDFLLYSRMACGPCNVVRATLMAFTWWDGKSFHTDELPVKHSLRKQRSWPLCVADEAKTPCTQCLNKSHRRPRRSPCYPDCKNMITDAYLWFIYSIYAQDLV